MVTMIAWIILTRSVALPLVPNVNMLSFSVTLQIVSIKVGNATEKMTVKMAQMRKDAVSVSVVVIKLHTG